MKKNDLIKFIWLDWFDKIDLRKNWFDENDLIRLIENEIDSLIAIIGKKCNPGAKFLAFLLINKKQKQLALLLKLKLEK